MADEFTIKEINRIVDQFDDEVRRLGRASQSATDAFNDASVGIRGYTSTLRQQNEILKRELQSLTAGLIRGNEGLGMFGGTLTSAGDAIAQYSKSFGVLGKIVGSLTGVLLGAAGAGTKTIDALNLAYQDLTRVGAGVGGFEDSLQMLQKFNYSVDQAGAAKLAGLLRENAESLQMWGGSVSRGSKALAEFSNDIRSRGLYQSFQNIGISSDEANKSMAAFAKFTLQSGLKMGKNQDEAAASLGRYVKEQEVINRLTGASREQQEKSVEAAMSEERFRARIMEAQAAGNEEEVKRLQTLAKVSANMPAEMRQGLLDSVTDPTTEAAIKFRMTFGSATENVDAFTKGVMPLGDMMQSLSVAGKEFTTTFTSLAKFGATGDFGFFVGAADLSLKYKDAASAAAEIQKNLEKTASETDNVTAKFNAIVRDQAEVRKLYESVTAGLSSTATNISYISSVFGKIARELNNNAASITGSEFFTKSPAKMGGTKGPEPLQYQNFNLGTMGETGQLFKNFGRETVAKLHGVESVQTPEQFKSIISNVMSATASFFDPITDKGAQARMAGLPVDAMLKDLGASMKASLAGPTGFASLAKMGAMPSFAGTDFVEPVATNTAKKIPDAGFSADRPIQIDSPAIVSLLNEQIIKSEEIAGLLRRLNGSSERIAQLA